MRKPTEKGNTMRILICLVAIAFLTCCAGASANIPKETPKPTIQPDTKEEPKAKKPKYTYDSYLSPATFEKWVKIGEQPQQDGTVYAMMNPSKYAVVKGAFVLVSKKGVILAYTYLKDGKVNYHVLTREGGYKEYVHPPKIREGIKKSLLDFEKKGGKILDDFRKKHGG